MLFGEALPHWQTGKAMSRPGLTSPVRWDNGHFFTDKGPYILTPHDFNNFDWHEVNA